MSSKALLCLLALVGLLFGQVEFNYFNQLSEVQVGNLPRTRPSDQFSYYQLSEASFSWRNWTVQLGVETFQKDVSGQRYTQLQHRSLEYRRGALTLTAGNFYEMFGRGLLLRGFKIPGAILESTQHRTRYSFYRDLDGLRLRYSGVLGEARLIWAKPLDNQFPPTFDRSVRRPETLLGADLWVPLGFTSLGGSWLRSELNGDTRRYGALHLSANLPAGSQLYVEFLRRTDDAGPFFSLSDEYTHGLYGGFSWSIGPIGLSAEIKDYNNLILGFNDPPPLIREHTFQLANRSTHVLVPSHETGWQVELFWSVRPNLSATFNVTRARNRLGNREPLFKEHYNELDWTINASATLRAFYDFSEEPLKLENNRHTGGAALEYAFNDRWSTILDVELQTFERPISGFGRATNSYLNLTLARAPHFSGGIVWERSTDIAYTDNPDTPELESRARNWFGVVLGLQMGSGQSVAFFAGERRGGTNCTSGICYEVLDFRGAELRINTRF
ncbi:MAG: hypothetical protein D6715_05250 [Calditrichaeota bacterium]|nr:MAG: hypothetical protein D6715_05250 [Calditrichota bacterium]